MQLAIDTSTGTAGLALVKDGEVLAELTWRCGQNHTTQLLPNLEYLLNQNKVNLQSLTGIIVARGPGSFNGLRVGVSTAKGLAFSLGIPIVGVSSLEVEAYPYAQTALPVCPVFNAGRGEIATATYRHRRGQHGLYGFGGHRRDQGRFSGSGKGRLPVLRGVAEPHRRPPDPRK